VLDTGDLGMINDDGDLVVLGRSDDETKLHGRRVRLAAVETVLRALLDVQDAAVAVCDDQLWCLWIPAHGAAGESPSGLGTLPPPIPSVWRPVEALPSTPSDKVDRRAVQRTVQQWAAADAHEATTNTPADPASEPPLPRSGGADVAATVLRLWRRRTRTALHVMDEDFFMAGGDSLRAMELLDDIETETGQYVDLADFLALPTPRNLVTLLRSASSG